MATRGRIQYQADGEHLIKGAKTFDIHPDLLEKIEEAGGGAIEAVKVNGVTQPITNKTVNITVPVVEDSLGSYSTTNALSANQGRVLYDAIQHLKSIGHFLSLWNAETGLPMDNPQLNPYPYNTGDYYIVSRVGSRNYRPSGAQYVAGQASTEEETETVAVDDFYFYNGTNWFHLSNEGPSLAIDTALSLTSTNAVENRVITNALNNKADRNDLDNYYTKTEVDDKIEAELQDAVKDGTLTIQKNGTDQGTFSANQATNKTINITMNKIDVGLENVDNTSDLNKPISTATQAALDLKADKTELNDYYKKTETYSQTEVDDLLDDKQDKLTAGDNIEIDSSTNEISATNNASYFKTQSEYDALPTTKTSDGNLYVIIDTRLNLMPFEELLALGTDTAILNELNSHAEDYVEVYYANGDINLQITPSSELPRQDAYLNAYMFVGTWNGSDMCYYGYYDTNLTNQELTAMGMPTEIIEEILSGEWNILGYIGPGPQ